MLKFFRRIRRKLLDEGSLKRYLIYSIGEILLVVVGILIALQINNWNEQRKGKREEKVALNDLVAEFHRNREGFQIHSEWQSDTESLWRKYLSQVSNIQLPDSIRAQERPRIGNSTFKISNNKLNSLLSTGYIDRIRSDTLKQLLLSWEDILLTYQTLEEAHIEHAQQHLIPIELRLKPNRRLRTISGIETTFYSPKEQNSIAINALTNMDYQNALILNHHWLILKTRRHQKIVISLDLIIEQLDSALNGNHVK